MPLTSIKGDEEPPTKITKLAIAEERDEDNYDYVTALRCWQCAPDGNLLPVAQSDPQVLQLYFLSCLTFA